MEECLHGLWCDSVWLFLAFEGSFLLTMEGECKVVIITQPRVDFYCLFTDINFMDFISCRQFILVVSILCCLHYFPVVFFSTKIGIHEKSLNSMERACIGFFFLNCLNHRYFFVVVHELVFLLQVFWLIISFSLCC